MKAKSILTLMVVVAVLVFVQCSGAKNEKAEMQNHDPAMHAAQVTDEPAVTTPQFEVTGDFQKQLAAVFSAYIGLKDAFVASNSENVKAGASSTLKALANVDMKLLTGAAHHDWMTYLGGMEAGLKKMASSSDIEEQRAALPQVTDNLYKSIKAFGLGGTIAYYEFCPMAFDSQGAHWLSTEEKIRNPYFGDKMMSCGSVQEKLQ